MSEVGSRIEMAITFALAGVGIWQVRTWLNLALDKLKDRLIARAGQRQAKGRRQ